MQYDKGMKNKSFVTPKGEKIIIKNRNYNKGGESGAIYGLGMLGALFYFLQNAHGLEMILWAIGKAFFWPAVLVYKVFTMLNL